MTREEYKAAIEAILFASGSSVPVTRLAQTLEITEKKAADLADELCKEFEESNHGVTVIKLEKSYQMVSKKAYAPQIRTAMDLRRNVPLSQAALEVLAVVAYNQPVTKSFIEQVRGVDCSGVIGSLTTKDLIEEKGRLELPGRPLLYGTTENFLRCFSISSLDELPELPQKQANSDENALDKDDSQLSIFESENAENVDSEKNNDETITATVGEIIEQATAE
ncbi:MAG: SMC-Scp complex subunit ScpB [Ruminococcus sp.]|nr:SMC-Scp complex subunit ScpB [Ruminococcus sp.]